MKRAFLLSLDAMVAVGLLLMLTAFLSSISMSYSSPELEYQRFYYVGKDVMNVLERAKLPAVLDFLPENYTQDCNITDADMEKTILDVLGYLWAQNSTTLNECAENLTRELLNKTLPPSFGYGVWLGGTNISRGGEPIENASYVSRLHTIVSGYELGKPVAGYFASAYISRMAKTTSSYVYFGGYVGDGNITKNVILPSDANVTGVYLELSTGNNFSLWVNGDFEGDYYPSPFNMTADNWTVCESADECVNFTTGDNQIEMIFKSPEKNYIGGGYMKITYNTSKPDTLPFKLSNETALKYYRFPGIAGVINLYSSFYIPGILNSMLVHMHYSSGCTANCTIFLNVGNVTIYESNETGEKGFNITNSTLYSLLNNYTSMSNQTVPLRMGLRNVSHVEGGEGTGDSALATDVSGSMDDCVICNVSWNCKYQYCAGRFLGFCWNWQWVECEYPGTCDDDECNQAGGETTRNHDIVCPECNKTKLDLAKEGNNEFIDVVLNYTGNRVGLVNYSTSTLGAFNLTDDNESLKAVVGNYTTEVWTCICCGILNATEMLVEQSDSSRRRSIVVMSDGETNVECTPHHVCNWWDDECIERAKDDTIQAACDAYENYGIVVYTIGYGDDADNETMNLTAQCGHGKYYYSNTTELAETYRQIAEEIAIDYFAQTVEIDYEGAYNSTLYDDSYIEFNYTPKDFLGYGEVSLSLESGRFGGNVTSPKNGTYRIPAGSRILDAKTTSYSSEFWTSSLIVNSSITGNWKTVYNLSDYSSDYGEKGEFVDLGDPFIVHIPIDDLVVGENNSVGIDTAFSSNDMTGGSPDDKVIYHVGVSGLVGYGEVFETLDNATDDAFQRLQNQLAEFNITMLEVKTSSHYLSELPSLWGPSVMEIRIWT